MNKRPHHTNIRSHYGKRFSDFYVLIIMIEIIVIVIIVMVIKWHVGKECISGK